MDVDIHLTGGALRPGVIAPPERQIGEREGHVAATRAHLVAARPAV